MATKKVEPMVINYLIIPEDKIKKFWELVDLVENGRYLDHYYLIKYIIDIFPEYCLEKEMFRLNLENILKPRIEILEYPLNI